MSAPLLLAADALTRLAIARGGLLDDFSATVYLDRLDRFDPDLVARACAQLSDEPRREFETALPDVGHIIERIEQIERDDKEHQARQRILPAPRHDETEPTYFCRLCWDEPSAWRLFWCPGTGEFRALDKPDRAAGMSTCQCARHKAHHPHTYADRCGCSDTNPVIARHRERIAAARPKAITSRRRRGGDE